MTKNSLDEEWPVLGSPGQGLTTKALKTLSSKRDSNVPEVWESTTLKGPWILDEKSKATADQIENDRLFAENLQDSEYTQLSEYLEYDENDEDNYNPAEQNEGTYEENDEDNYNPEEQEEQTNEKNEISFDGHGHLEASRALPKISRV